MSIWEPFTERARRVIVLAQEEAQRLGDNYTATEHILLGMFNEGNNVASKFLDQRGITLSCARREVEALVGRGGKTVRQESVMTPRVKKVIAHAFDVKKEWAQNYIGTEHLLLGLLREDSCVAARALANLGMIHSEALEGEVKAFVVKQTGKIVTVPASIKTISSALIDKAAAAMPLNPANPREIAVAMFEAAGFREF